MDLTQSNPAMNDGDFSGGGHDWGVTALSAGDAMTVER